MRRHNSLERSHDVSRRQLAGSGLGPLQLVYSDCEGENSQPQLTSAHLSSPQLTPPLCLGDQTGQTGQTGQYPELCLSLSIGQGYLIFHVMAGRNVPHLPTGLPDTLVKTCLKEGERRFLKKKSRLVCSTTDPFYNHRVKFLASDLPRR